MRQETLGDDKNYFQTKYQVYAGTADLYAYFIERGVNLLARGGWFGYIVANKWMRANYGRALRVWLKTKCIEEITDFGDLPVFEKATTYPCILRISNNTPHNQPWVTNVKTLAFPSLADYVGENGETLDQTKFDDDGWSLVSASSQEILEKLQLNSISLSDYVDNKIYYGIKTGLNEAFVIDEATKNQIITNDPKSDALIKPFAIGREIKRYKSISTNQFLILIPKGWTNSKKTGNAWKWFSSFYPAIANHLSQYEQKASKRYDKGDYWWELRVCDYYQEFEKPKITWGNLAITPKFCIDYDGFYVNAPSVIISSDDLYLLGILNSKICYYVISKIAAGRQGGVRI